MRRPNPLVMIRLLRRAGAPVAGIARLVVEAALFREGRGAHRLIELHGRSRPGIAAVVEGEARTGFADLARRVRRIAGALGARGLGPGDRFVIALPNSADLVAVSAAVRTLGAVRVPASPQWKAEELRHCLADCGARGIAFAEAGAAAVEEASRGLESLRRALVIGALDELLGAPDVALPKDVLDREPDQPAIMYTSGTTGVPKGARPSVPDLARAAEAIVTLLRLGPRETILVPAPLHHTAPALMADLAMLLGATLVLPARFDPEETLALIERERVTCAYLVPHMIERILRLPAAVRGRYARPSLRAVISAAAPLRPEARLAACDLFGDVLMEFYGSTETGIATFLAPEEQRAHAETVGRAIPGVDLAILGEDGRERPAGEAGEVCVRSAWVRTEYLGLAAATAEAHHERFFRTGDLGSLDAAGYLTLRGRAKDMVNTGGVKVFPAEVERALGRHPEVEDAAVFPLADERWGEAVCAAVVRAPGAACDEASLQGWLKAHLASYKVPKRIMFELELPRNPQGKVLKRILRDRYERDRRDAPPA